MHCGNPKKSPCTSICYFYIFWSFGTVGLNTFIWEQSFAKPGARTHEGCRICHDLSRTDSLSNRVSCFLMLDAVFPKDLFSDWINVLFCTQNESQMGHWKQRQQLSLRNVWLNFLKHITTYGKASNSSTTLIVWRSTLSLSILCMNSNSAINFRN